MPVNGQDVKFNYYTRAKFNALSSKDNNAIYYVEETNNTITMYLGNSEVAAVGDVALDKLNVTDIRTIGDGSDTFNLTPNQIEDKTLKPYFAQLAGTGWSYRSLITVKGWTANYATWQLIGPAGTAADDDLYFRSGAGSSWRTPRKIFHSGNLTAGDIPGLDTKADKTDLAGAKNLNIIDLAGKVYLGKGVYRLFNENSRTLDYNVYNGVFTFSGSFTSGQHAYVPIGYARNWVQGTSYTTTVNVISTSAISGNPSFETLAINTGGNYSPYWINTTPFVAIRNGGSGSATYSNQNNNIVYLRIRLGSGSASCTFTNWQFTLQIEQGTQSTDYEVPIQPIINTALTGSGNHSIQLGLDASASEELSTALGSYTTASGTQSTALGYDATASGAGSTALGRRASASGTYTTALGYNASAGATSRLMRLGATDLSTLQSQVNLSVVSDIRDKADIEEVPKALDFIKDLNPITYVGNDRDHYISDEQKETDTYKDYLMVEDYDRESHSQGTKKGERRRVGLSAQEVREKLIEHYGSDNYANVVNDNFVEFEERGLDIPEDLENKLTMSYETMVPFLIKAIQEQQEQIEELKKKINFEELDNEVIVNEEITEIEELDNEVIVNEEITEIEELDNEVINNEEITEIEDIEVEEV